MFGTYWGRAGWRRDTTTAAEDFEYARKAGYMFDPVEMTHDEIVNWLCGVRGKVTQRAVTEAFAASLGSRRLDAHSALGSYAFASCFPAHRLCHSPTQTVPSGNVICLICGTPAGPERSDLNVLNFERFKWGGVRHQDPLYAAFDLSQFSATEKETPTAGDYLVLSHIVETAAVLPTNARPRDLERRIAPLFRSNKAEREMLIECLAYCGILAPALHPGFFMTFTPADQRTTPSVSKIDWQYPVSWWRGSDGVNRQAISHYFPEIGTPMSLE